MEILNVIVIELLKSGVKWLESKYGTDLSQIITRSIEELSEISPEYQTFSYVLHDIVQKGAIKIEKFPEGKDKLATEIGSKISESPFFNKYCNPTTYPPQKVKEILIQFIDILEKNLAKNTELSNRLTLGYHKVTLDKVGEIQKDVKQMKMAMPALKEEKNAIARSLSFDGNTSVSHKLDSKSDKFRYLAALFEFGIYLDRNGECEKAFSKYRAFLKDKCSSRHPRYFAALNNTGKVLSEQGKHKEALKYLKQAYDIAPRRSVAMLNLAVAYFFIGDLDRSMAYALKAKPKRQTDPNVYNTLGIIYAEKSKTGLALRTFNIAVRIDRGFAPAYANRAILYGDKKSFEKAEKDIQKAIVLDNTNANFYITYGVLLQKIFYSALSAEISKHDRKSATYYIKPEDIESLSEEQTDILDKAIEKFEKGIELGIQLEKNRVLSTNLAACYHTRKRFKEAEKVYKKITVKRDEDYPWHGLGDLYFQTGRPKLAIKCYKKLLGIDPENAHVHTALVRTYGEMDDLSTALEHAKEACRLAPEDQRYKFNLGFTYELMDRLQLAQEIFEELKQTGFDIGSVNFHLGQIYFLQQMYGSARECLLEAKRHGVPHEILSELLAFSAGLSQKLDISQEEFKFLISKEPKKFLYNFNYARLLDGRGRSEDAKRHYVNALNSTDAKKYGSYTAWISRRLYEIDKQSGRIIHP